MSPVTPVIAIHMTAAILAVVTGPIALWARKGALQRPKLHRAFGYAWVTLMIIAAASAFFIRGGHLPNINGFSPIHLFIPFVFFGLVRAFWALAKGNVVAHRKFMTNLYWGACVGAGAFALLPSRIVGNFLFA
ncbi:DUF2306 domain-containing protein [Caenimonas koreensis]|uniref:DUF2306 domain-containing protein n=1 Tax=Caenimonas koreensis DSM 17982 TaxID=1121255 RepID=A0A844AUP7_9BURK|nr:DUF2306 domain-containing protein [Caenimonas koreensis]MRD47824.1 DUF2306 domain-containing protein [Caenimonas koreensis DSM 17982]